MLTGKQLEKFRERFPVLPPTDRAWRDQVVAAPDDLELRMVYADVLLERGDPMGELIGIQFRLLDTPDGAARAALQQREAELLRKVVVRDKRWRTLHGWITHEVQDLGGTNCTIRAGFVESIYIDAERLRANGKALFAIAPINSLFVHDASSAAVIAIAGEPWFRQLRSIDVMARPGRSDPIKGRALAAIVDTGQALRHLRLWNGSINAKALGAFDNTTLPALRSLVLDNQPLGSATPLTRWPGLARLERLTLRDCELDTPAVTELLRTRMENLVELDLSQNRLGAAGTRAIAAAAENLPKLATLRLVGCNITKPSAKKLYAAFDGVRILLQRDE